MGSWRDLLELMGLWWGSATGAIGSVALSNSLATSATLTDALLATATLTDAQATTAVLDDEVVNP